MAFPQEIVTFPTMKDVTATDGSLITAYQQAIEANDLARAETILHTIPDYNKKVLSANLLNSLLQLGMDLETFYLDRYSPAYVVSASQPSTQGKYDFWFQITGTVVMP